MPPTGLCAVDPSFTVAVAVVVEDPSALMTVGFRTRVTSAGEANSVKGADAEWPPELAEMLSVSAVVDALIWTEHVPSAAPELAVVHEFEDGKVASPLVPKVTVAPGTRFPVASLTVAVAVDVDAPSAGIEDGTRPRLTRATGPVSVSMAVPWVPFLVAVAVMVSVSAVVEAWMVTEQVPLAAVVQVDPPGKLTSPPVAKETGVPATRLLLASLTVAVAVEVDVPSAAIELGLSVTATVAG